MTSGSTSGSSVPISVVVPTYCRKERLTETLSIVQLCDPLPAEILVHVDAGDDDTAILIKDRFPGVRILKSNTTQGPGGARNLLVAESKEDLIVSLDDDSFPLDGDFFAAVIAAFKANPMAAVISMKVIHNGEMVPDRVTLSREVGDFIGCGCAYRRDAFIQTSGYVPLSAAYGMEEADLALQLLDKGWSIIEYSDLRVRHATDRGHQKSRQIVAAHVRNTALLAFLRYPPRLTFFAMAQVLNRVIYSTRRGHILGVAQGLLEIPSTLVRYRKKRRPVRVTTVAHRRRLQRGL